jgi:hypothetical protein
MSDPIAELSRLRATDDKLLRDAKRQFSWLDVLFISFQRPAFILWMAPGRAGTEAIVLTSLVMVTWRVSARLDAAVTLIQQHLPKA